MQTVIFAGGLGTRISEETDSKPKPMVEIGGKPIIWHVMKIYQAQGFNEFIICLGYKGYLIKEYFLNYFIHNSDVTIDLRNNDLDIHYTKSESFKVTLVDTGLHTKTAGRLKRIREYIGENDFLLTYGDGLGDINLKSLVDFHQSHGKIATLTSVKPMQNYGTLRIDEMGKITQFREKSQDDAIWINAGFFVLKPEVFNYLPNNSDEIMWEDSPLENLTKDEQLYAYKHKGYWKCMDAMRDKIELDKLWEEKKAKWKIW